MMSFVACYVNRDIVFTAPHLSGPGVVFTNDMLKTYFVVDALYHIWKFGSKFRRDLLFHHIIIVIPFFIIPHAIGITFPIMAEIYSTGALFRLTPANDLKYRATIIITIRLFIWTTLFRTSFTENQEFIHVIMPLIISSSMLLLDAYWLKLIYAKVRNLPSRL
jgi:hypothetical protein